VYSLLCWILRLRRSDGFAEAWAVFNMVLAAGMAVLACTEACRKVVGALILGYAGVRVFELMVYLVNVLLLDPFRKRRAGTRYCLVDDCRFLLLLLHNYAEVVFWFAATLLLLAQWSLLSLGDPSFWGVLRTAFVGMVSLSLEGVRPLQECARVILAAQPWVGAFLTLLTLARLVSLIPAPESCGGSKD
jgi:hypothetical protein